MKLTEEQTRHIRSNLYNAVIYLETFNEVYDHVLTCIENLDGDFNEQTLNTVIDTEFAGFNHLTELEKEQAKAAYKAMRQKHWQHIARFFNIPFVGFTLTLTIAAYFLVADPVRCQYLMAITGIGAVMPFLVISIGRVKSALLRIKTKPTIKQNYIFGAALLSTSLYNILGFINHRLWANGSISLFVFVFFAVYVSGFFSLYQQEIKMRIAK